MNFVNCDLYIKLSQHKFVKIKNAGDSIDHEALLKYENKDIDSCYILVSSAKEFMHYLLLIYFLK